MSLVVTNISYIVLAVSFIAGAGFEIYSRGFDIVPVLYIFGACALLLDTVASCIKNRRKK